MAASWLSPPTYSDSQVCTKRLEGSSSSSGSLLSTTESTGHSQPCSPWITPVHRAPVTTETKEMIPLNSARDDREEVRKE